MPKIIRYLNKLRWWIVDVLIRNKGITCCSGCVEPAKVNPHTRKLVNGVWFSGAPAIGCFLCDECVEAIKCLKS